MGGEERLEQYEDRILRILDWILAALQSPQSPAIIQPLFDSMIKVAGFLR